MKSEMSSRASTCFDRLRKYEIAEFQGMRFSRFSLDMPRNIKNA